MKKNMEKIFFSIGDVSKILGVEQSVVRFWEKEFNVKPKRTSSGRRIYQKKDISKLLEIKKLLYDDGYTIKGAKKILAQREKSGKEPDFISFMVKVREELLSIKRYLDEGLTNRKRDRDVAQPG